MFRKLLEILKNRAKIGGVNFLLEMIIGVLAEWQNANRAGTLDFNQKKDVLDDVARHQNDASKPNFKF